MTRPAILLVDDERAILQSLREQLRRLFGKRFAYETAQSAPEAWEVLEELAEDGVSVVLIVSDWLMPEVRGDRFLAEVRARYPEIVRVLLTGQADPDVLRRVANEETAFRVLFKPWSAQDLKSTIEDGVGG